MFLFCYNDTGLRATAMSITSEINMRESVALFDLNTPMAYAVNEPPTHGVAPSPPRPKSPVPPPRSGSHDGASSQFFSRPAPPHALPAALCFFSLQQMQHAPREIRKVREFVSYIFTTRHEVTEDIMGLTQPLHTLHNRRMEARADIMCELRTLKGVLDLMFGPV